MIPLKHSSIFKSRYMALLWAAGIIWFAYDFAAPDDAAAVNNAESAQLTDVTGAPITSAQEKQFETILNGL